MSTFLPDPRIDSAIRKHIEAIDELSAGHPHDRELRLRCRERAVDSLAALVALILAKL
jgi:hypothetical protein